MPCVVTISIAVVVDWDSYLVFMEMNDKLIDGQTNNHTNKQCLTWINYIMIIKRVLLCFRHVHVTQLLSKTNT